MEAVEVDFVDFVLVVDDAADDVVVAVVDGYCAVFCQAKDEHGI